MTSQHIFLETLASHLSNGVIPTSLSVPMDIFSGMRMDRRYVEYLILRTQPCGVLHNVAPSYLSQQVRGQSEYFLLLSPKGVPLFLFAVTYAGIYVMPQSEISATYFNFPKT